MLGGGADGAPDAAPPGCETPTVARYPSTARADGDTLRASLLRADASFSALSADSGAAPAFATFVADDGVGLGAGPAMSCGPAAMRQAFEHAGPGALTWEPRLADAAPSGDLGFTVGVAGFRSSSQTLYSKYLTIWRRQRSGEWRFVADGGNAAPAPAP
jgi:ketosteroid isomerase-like protein